MSGLLGDVCQMRLQVQTVTAATVFVDVMILKSQFGKVSCFDVRPEAYSACIQNSHFGESVLVGIIGRTVAVLSEHIDARFLVIRDHGRVDVGHVLRTLAGHGQLM